MAVGEWDQRQLCPNGGCVGVIGPDGTCKVCGRAAQNWGDERKRGLLDPPDEDGEGEDAEGKDVIAKDIAAKDADLDADHEGDDAGDVGDEDDEGGADPPLTASSSPDDWGSRQLCPDGACIGVIGPDGTCKVCGRAASDVLRATGLAPAAVLASDQPSDPPGDPAITDAITAGDPDSTKRRRCSDAACPGVSGPDGHCEVCGKVVT